MKRKRSSSFSSSCSSSGSFRPSTSPEPDLRTFAARLWLSLKESHNVPKAEFVKAMNDSGCVISKRSFARHVASVRKKKSAVLDTASKKSGRKRMLSDEEKDIAAGWMLQQGLDGHRAHAQDYQQFIAENFGVQRSLQTARNYIHESGLTLRVCGKSSLSRVVPDHALLKRTLRDWIVANRAELNRVPRSKIASIDFTFTSHRAERETTYALVGSQVAAKAGPFPKYTNAAMTCIWADGVNRTPSVLLTYNPAFRLDRNPTSRREEQREHLLTVTRELQADLSQIANVGNPSNEHRVYVAETDTLVQKFVERYPIEEGCIALTDNGHAFFSGGNSVLTKIGFGRHIAYPASVHQILSPNDNHLHGVAKRRWKSQQNDFLDDVRSSVTPLHYLDEETTKHAKTFFDRNIFDRNFKDVGDLVCKKPNKKSLETKRRRRLHRLFKREDPRGPQDHVPEELKDKLDGEYWSCSS